jgi:hypothetical protein
MNSSEIAILHTIAEIDKILSSATELYKHANQLSANVAESNGNAALSSLHIIKTQVSDIQKHLKVLDRQLESLEKYGRRI